MINMENVTKIYETTLRKGWFQKQKVTKIAVNELSLEIRPGEIVGLLGLNGAGKTTTIKMLSTLLEPTKGTISIDGLDINRNRRSIQSMINVITGSERLLYWRLTGRENLAYFGRLYGLSETQVRERSEGLLRTVGLLEAAELPVEQYSKGMKQRLQIARGLINDPKYVFLDEPTIGLDAPVARQLRTMVRRMVAEEGKGLLLTSHYLQEVEELCDRVYVLDRGRLLLADSPQAIIRRTSGQQMLQLLISPITHGLAEQLADALRIPRESVRVEGDQEEHQEDGTIVVWSEDADNMIPAVLSWLSQAGVRVRRLSVEKPSLEDAIIRLAEGASDDEQLLARLSG
ncbi:MAG: ABC transporter ATP-binding protein [Gorillibacterium sp.]|nr:ABC transporter ATP-binding protein [Gorillibacterium sp.]